MARTYPEGTCPAAPETMPELDGILVDLGGLYKVATEASDSLSDFFDRMRGPSPTAGGAAEKLSRGGAGTLGDLKRGIDDTRATLLGILDMTRGLKDIG